MSGSTEETTETLADAFTWTVASAVWQAANGTMGTHVTASAFAWLEAQEAADSDTCREIATAVLAELERLRRKA